MVLSYLYDRRRACAVTLYYVRSIEYQVLKQMRLREVAKRKAEQKVVELKEVVMFAIRGNCPCFQVHP